MTCYLTRRYPLSLIHKIPAEFVGDECSQVHGHDFKVAVTLRHADFSIPKLDQIVTNEILEPYSSHELVELQQQFTGEALAREFLARLRRGRLGHDCISVQVTETRKNRFEAVEKIRPAAF